MWDAGIVQAGLSIGAAAARLGTTARMLRYREYLGLLASPRLVETLGRPNAHKSPQVPGRGPSRAGSMGRVPADGRRIASHRRYGEAELQAAAYAIRLEARHDVSPKALAFALRALTEPQVHAEVRELGRLCGRLPWQLAALDFEQQKAQRLLRRDR